MKRAWNGSLLGQELWLPNILVAHVFSFLPLNAYLQCQLVCRQWNTVSLEPHVKHRFPFTGIKFDECQRLNHSIAAFSFPNEYSGVHLLFTSRDRCHVLMHEDRKDDPTAPQVSQVLANFSPNNDYAPFWDTNGIIPTRQFFSHVDVFDDHLIAYQARELPAYVWQYHPEKKIWEVSFETHGGICFLTVHPSEKRILILAAAIQLRIFVYEKEIAVDTAHAPPKLVFSHSLGLGHTMMKYPSAYFSNQGTDMLLVVKKTGEFNHVFRMNPKSVQKTTLTCIVLPVQKILGYIFSLSVLVGLHDCFSLHFFNESSGNFIVKINLQKSIDSCGYSILGSSIFFWDRQVKRKGPIVYYLKLL
jgi:hypothetical protein